MYKEIPYQSPLELFAPFSEQPGAVLLHSADERPGCGRYSFIGVDPFLILKSKNNTVWCNGKKEKGNPFAVVEKQLSRYSFIKEPDLPPFQGGMMGFFSYDIYSHLETFSSNQLDEWQFPDMAVGFYDVVISVDHLLKRAWVFSSGFPEEDPNQQTARAIKRMEEISQKKEEFFSVKRRSKLLEIASNFTEQKYINAVERVKEYIAAGDIFEANISQRFEASISPDFSEYALYAALQSHNPAPFSAYMKWDEEVIASASPERFLKVTGSQVETRPIKGTRPRGQTELQDKALALELVNSEKDHAENVMIVDLLRNDLSRVCKPHSVVVNQLCGLESYAHVHHLVSSVEGELEEKTTAFDLLKVCFPGGSVTGAPKIRAMEIIAEIEPTKRGPYCGCMGYIGFDGDMDTAVTIRTFAIKNNKIVFQAGGAVTLDSDPSAEYQETLTKAAALKKVL